MSNQLDFSLINGRFDPEDAATLVAGITHIKLQYHAQRIVLHETREEDIKASEKRMKQIEADLRDVLQFIQSAAQRGSRIEIEGSFLIKEVVAKSR